MSSTRCDPDPSGAGPAPDAVLDNPVWHAIDGPQRGLGLLHGPAAHYAHDVAPFAAVAPGADPRDQGVLSSLNEVVPPGAVAVFTGHDPVTPAGWTVEHDIVGWQLVDSPALLATAEADAAGPDELLALGAADVPEMLALTELTRPGPFLSRTVEFGGYLGIRRGGRLVAMAGRRMQPAGWCEVSAVCTDPDHVGQGLARRLLLAVVLGIRDDGMRAFLHVAGENERALALYRHLGFADRQSVHFLVCHRSDPADRR